MIAAVGDRSRGCGVGLGHVYPSQYLLYKTGSSPVGLEKRGSGWGRREWARVPVWDQKYTQKVVQMDSPTLYRTWRHVCNTLREVKARVDDLVYG